MQTSARSCDPASPAACLHAEAARAGWPYPQDRKPARRGGWDFPSALPGPIGCEAGCSSPRAWADTGAGSAPAGTRAAEHKPDTPAAAADNTARRAAREWKREARSNGPDAAAAAARRALALAPARLFARRPVRLSAWRPVERLAARLGGR